MEGRVLKRYSGNKKEVAVFTEKEILRFENGKLCNWVENTAVPSADFDLIAKVLIETAGWVEA